jgi:hypothetical protein
MLTFIVGIGILLLFVLLPWTRKATIKVVALLAIAAVGVAGIGLPVWALYEAKPLLVPTYVRVEDSAGQASGDGEPRSAIRLSEDLLPPEHEIERLLLEEERQRLAEEERKREEERIKREKELERIAGIVESARAVVERDRRYAEVAATSPRLPGIDQVSADLITIRIPSWRDELLAQTEKEQIRTWLHSIGLTPEETASIYTANGWGSVYDLWRKDMAAAEQKEEGAGEAADTAEVPGPDDGGPETEQAADTAASTGQQGPVEPIARQTAPRRFAEPAPPPRPARPAPAPAYRPPASAPSRESQVGPFGY